MGNVWKTAGFLGLIVGQLLLLTDSGAEPAAPPPEPKPVLRLQGQTPGPEPAKPEERRPNGKPYSPLRTPSESPPQPPLDDGVYRGFSLMVSTPLIRETTFETRFHAIGLQALFSLPLTPIGQGPHGVALETGVIATYSSLRLPFPSLDFTYISVNIPIRARVVFALGDWRIEAFVGSLVESFQLDSRPAPEGGFHADFRFLFDGGAGVSYPLLSDSARLRLLVAYTSMALGAEWEF